MARALAAAITVVSTAPWYTLPISRPAAVFTEVAPALLRLPSDAAPSPGCPPLQPRALALYMSTGYVGLCAANASGLPTAAGAPPLGFDLATCSVPFSGESWRDFPPAGIPRGTEHFRNYDGVMSAVVVPASEGGPSLLLVRHGEHKNELCWANSNLYQGLINADVDARVCSSGFHGGAFSDCAPAYNAFVSGALAPFAPAACYGLGAQGNASTADLGPLAWPVAGYLNASRGKASYGVRQPSALAAWDGAPVLLWIDNGFATADVWVARAPPGARPAAAAFAAHSAARGAWDLPLLPPRLAAEGIMAALQERSPAAPGAGGGAPAFALAPSAGAVHAAGARLRVRGAPSPYHLVVYDIVNYTQCYGGAGEGSAGGSSSSAGGGGGELGTRLVRELLSGRRCSGGACAGAPTPPAACTPPWRLMLRVTADFVAWSEPVELARYAAPGWGAAPLAYPTLLSADGASADEVDAEDFFVMGTCAQAGGGCGSTYGPQVTVARVAIALQEAGEGPRSS